MCDQRPVVFLRGERLYLRPIEEGDLHRMTVWLNDPNVRKYLGRILPIDMIAEREWIENGLDRSSPPSRLVFAVVLIDGDRHIGNMNISGIDWFNRFGTTGTVIGEADCWGKGYAREAKLLLLEYAFNTLGLRRIESRVLMPNTASWKCLERCGYKREGVARQKYFRDGTWLDELFYAITVTDWQTRKM